MRKAIVISCMILLLADLLHAQRKLTVMADKPVAEIAPTMWGIFFEDINFAADGGLYAEMVKNRSFDFPMPMTGWKEVKRGGSGKILFINNAGRYARIKVDASNNYGINNEGFRGMGIKPEPYHFSIRARRLDGNVD